MLKYALLGAAALIATPALAQTNTSPQAPAAPTAQEMPAPAQAQPMTPAPTATDAAPVADGAAVAPTTAATQPVAAEQVASAVDDQFTTYDKDANGKLNEVEFSAWMVALKTQSDPKTDANAPATKKWNKAAFAQADKDKSKSLSKDELAGFLTPAKS